MNSDFRVAVGFTRHPKTIRLRSLLGPDAVSRILELWEFVAVHRPKGDLSGLDPSEIAASCGWGKRWEVVWKSLRTAGFLDQNEDGTYSVHAWDEHNNYAAHAPERSEMARKAANARHARGRAERNADGMRSADKAHMPLSVSVSGSVSEEREARARGVATGGSASPPPPGSDRSPKPEKARTQPESQKSDPFARRWARRKELVEEVKRDGLTGPDARAEESRRFKSEFPDEPPPPTTPTDNLDAALGALGDGS